MKKNMIKLLAILLIVILSITSSIFFKNNKVSADEYYDITYNDYSGWNPDYCAGKNIIGRYEQYAGSFIQDIQWGDLDCDGDIDNIDLQYLEHALKRDKYFENDGFACAIVYDLADVAEPYGVIDYTDYVELSAVAHGENFRQNLPIYSVVGHNITNYDRALAALDGNYQTGSNEDICIAVSIYTNAIKCIGAPRVLGMVDGTGYNLGEKIQWVSFLMGENTTGDGVTVNYYSNGKSISSIIYSPRVPSNEWFKYEITENYYHSKYAIYH